MRGKKYLSAIHGVTFSDHVEHNNYIGNWHWTRKVVKLHKRLLSSFCFFTLRQWGFRIIVPPFATNDDSSYTLSCRKWNRMAQWVPSSFHHLMRVIVCRQIKLNCKLYWLWRQVSFAGIHWEPLNSHKEIRLSTYLYSYRYIYYIMRIPGCVI